MTEGLGLLPLMSSLVPGTAKQVASSFGLHETFHQTPFGAHAEWQPPASGQRSLAERPSIAP